MDFCGNRVIQKNIPNAMRLPGVIVAVRSKDLVDRKSDAMPMTTIEPALEQRVGDILGEQELLTLSAGTIVTVATRQMAERYVGAVLVMDGGELVGIFTERDLLERVVAAGLDPDKTALVHVMTPNPISVQPETDLLTAIFIMRDHGTRHLPVKVGKGVLGIFSVRDLLRYVVRDAMAGKLERDDLWIGFPE